MNIINEYLRELLTLYLEISPYMLLGMFLVGLLHILFSKEFVIKHVGSDNIGAVVKASVLGVPLPLCSCGVIPTAVYMAKNGASKGAVISFLVSTPQTGIDSIIATYGMLGWFFAIYRPVIAFINGILAGIIVNIFGKKEKLKLEAEQKKSSSCGCGSSTCTVELNKPENENVFTKKIKSFYNYAFKEFLDDIANHFIVGLLISAVIGVAIPDNFFTDYNLGSGLGGMILMAVIGVPMYICATSSIPVALVLMMKGVSPGAAFVFLTAGPVTNAASIAILSKILGKKILSIYLGTTLVLAVLSGLLLDLLFNIFDIKLVNSMMEYHHKEKSIIFIIYAGVFLLFLTGSLWRKNLKKFFVKSKLRKTHKEGNMPESVELKVEGMTCNHCVFAVKKALETIKGVTKVNVNLNQKKAIIEGEHLHKEELIKLINEMGYQANPL